MTSIFNQSWRLLEEGETEAEWNRCRPLTICAGNEDLASVYSDEDATVSISRFEAVRAATMMTAAPDMAAALEAMVDTLSCDHELRHQYALLISAGESALRKAYGETNKCAR
jgi:hypothetical protein